MAKKNDKKRNGESARISSDVMDAVRVRAQRDRSSVRCVLDTILAKELIPADKPKK